MTGGIQTDVSQAIGVATLAVIAIGLVVGRLGVLQSAIVGAVKAATTAALLGGLAGGTWFGMLKAGVVSGDGMGSFADDIVKSLASALFSKDS